jgi:vacuolar-type H+-ATPase subunit I/STV1
MDDFKKSNKQIQTMCFVMNALNDGWKVEKISDEYIFTKKHEGKREIFRTEYLETFIHSNLDIQKILKSK